MTKSPRVPLSEDPRMDELENILRKLPPDRQGVFMDHLENDNLPEPAERIMDDAETIKPKSD